ncbi:hypothetical protein [Microcoleus sp. CAWBG58]|uniref:hypothetical protein n=1 Tax=Microcoleus sp. CAWBG58 TaxID=2841651 RepID=UPI0025F62E74|nr:hypothetical protein [Microcoleus sp. CAWBG58]
MTHVLILKNFSTVKTAGIDHSLEYLSLLPIDNLFCAIGFCEIISALWVDINTDIPIYLNWLLCYVANRGLGSFHSSNTWLVMQRIVSGDRTVFFHETLLLADLYLILRKCEILRSVNKDVGGRTAADSAERVSESSG